MVSEPKYSLPEVERRWLVAPSHLSMLEGQSYREVEDLYVAQTRLRLRRVSGTNGEVVYKFCKKYGKASSSLVNSITNLYLSESEYLVLAALKGNAVCKRRYSLAGGAIDVYAGEPVVAVFEVEFGSEQEAEQYVPPSFVGEEVTSNELYSGAALAAKGA